MSSSPSLVSIVVNAGKTLRRMSAMEGVRVIELGGLAPGPFAGMVLSDFGAQVVRIDRPGANNGDRLAMNKMSIVLDLKQATGVRVLWELIDKADVLIEPFRPGVMEKMGFGPEGLQNNHPIRYLIILAEVRRRNKSIVYARMTGFRRDGNVNGICYIVSLIHG